MWLRIKEIQNYISFDNHAFLEYGKEMWAIACFYMLNSTN